MLTSFGLDVITQLGPFGHISATIHAIASIVVSKLWFVGPLNRMEPSKTLYDVILMRWCHLVVTSSPIRALKWTYLGYDSRYRLNIGV